VSDRGQSEYEINSAAIRRFAQGGKDLDMPVLLAVQLNREVETRSSKRPILADLRGSGRIEEDARVVWFAFRPGYYKPEDESLEHNWELIIAKAAHGPTGKVDLWCDLPKMFIRDVNVPGTDAGDGY
jgi:replicative DNA helicase